MNENFSLYGVFWDQFENRSLLIPPEAKEITYSIKLDRFTLQTARKENYFRLKNHIEIGYKLSDSDLNFIPIIIGDPYVVFLYRTLADVEEEEGRFNRQFVLDMALIALYAIYGNLEGKIRGQVQPTLMFPIVDKSALNEGFQIFLKRSL